MTEDRLKEIEQWIDKDFDGFSSEAEMVTDLIAEVRRLRAARLTFEDEADRVGLELKQAREEVRMLRSERVSYKAKLVDQRWEIEQKAASAALESAAERMEDWANKHDAGAVLKAEDAPGSSEMHFTEATVARRHAALLRIWAKEAAQPVSE